MPAACGRSDRSRASARARTATRSARGSCEGGERVRAELDRHERRCRSRRSAPHRGAAQHRRLARSTLIFSVATGLSRVLGLVREMVAAYYFGINGKINAFTVAFQIPNLVRALLADAALSGAFVPVFSDLIEKGDRKRAWRVASTVFWLVLLVLGGAHGALHPHRAAPDQAVRRPGRRLRPRRRALARALPDRRAARAQRRHRRDPQHLRPLHRARADAGVLEPRDHRRALARRAARQRRGRGSSTSTPARSSSRTADPAVPARALAARARRPAAARARLARPGGAPDLRADAARDADARADQRQRRDRHADRLAPRRPRPRPGRDQLGVPALHAAAGDVLGRGRDRAVPGPRAARGAERPRRLPRHDQHRPAPDRLPPDPGRGHLGRPRRRRSCGSSTSAARSPRAT